MTDAQFQSEKLFLATMAVVRSMLDQALISPREYDKIRDMMIARYQPPISSLTTTQAENLA